MFFPYSTERELRGIPYATITLIALNVLCAVLWFHPDLFAVLALDTSPEAFRWWQLVSYTFLQAGQHSPEQQLDRR